MRETWEFFIKRKIPGLSGTEINEILALTDWDTWVYKPSLAPVDFDFSTPTSDQAVELALDYIALNGTTSPGGYRDYLGYFSLLKVVFHSTLLENIDSLNIDILKRIDSDYGCTTDLDPEVRSRWFPIGLTLGYAVVFEPAHAWVSSIGRMKFLRPIYTALVKSKQ